MPRDYYDLNLRTNKKRRLLRRDAAVAQVEVAGDGKPWLGRGIDNEQSDYVWYVPAAEDGDWKEIFRLDMNSAETFRVEGFDVNNRNILFVSATNGDDRIGLWEFVVDHATFGELIYRRQDTDVIGVRYHSNYWASPDVVTGVIYYTDKEHVEYFDSGESALYAQLAGLIPAAFNLTVTSRSKDGQTLTIHNVGPQDPGSNYLLKDGALKFLGGSNPLLSPAELAPMTYLDYASADGTTAHAYVTVPHGEHPLPTVVLQRHDNSGRQVVDYDALTQVLASSGYLVLQLLVHNKDVQADAVAGMQYLVQEGMVDPDRIALLVWNNDAMPALHAASPAEQPFQCVIGVLPATATNGQSQHVGALAVDSHGDVDVPVLLIHSGVVPSVPYVNTFDTLGSNHKIIALGEPGLSHGAKLFDYRSSFFHGIIDFLSNDCGPSGL